ncbi:hypothetical protein C0992_001119, partial [Termitomyces sp. T32_za158]
ASAAHLDALLYREKQPQPLADPVQYSDILDNGLRHFLASFSGLDGTSLYPSAGTQSNNTVPDSGINWNLFEAREETQLAPSAMQQGVALTAQALLEQLNNTEMHSDDDSYAERSDGEGETEPAPEPYVSGVSKCIFEFLLIATHWHTFFLQ